MLPKFLGSLRFRIVAYSLLAFTLVLVILSFYIFTAYERYLREEFEDRLRESARIISESIAIAADATVTPVPQVSPYRFPNYYFLIRASDGRILEKSNNLGKNELPFSPLAQSSKPSDTPILETTSAEVPTNKSLRLRLLTLYFHGENTAPYFLQVASSFEQIERNISELRRTVLVACLVGLIVAGLSAFLVAWRSLRSISQIARQAKDLGADKLDRRIATPNSEDEVADLVKVINGMLDRLEKAFNAQQRFIADVSHEFRTPLSVLLGQAQVLIQQERPVGMYQDFIGRVQDEMRQLAELVTSLLTLERAHAGFPIPGTKHVSVCDFVVEAVERCKPLAIERKVRLVPALPDPDSDGIDDMDDPTVEGDAELLRTMLSNIVRNAIRFSPAQQSVDVRIQVSPTNATITVADRGPGIPSEHITGLFERFYQAQKPEGGKSGTGLGLAIAKAVVEIQHGTIAARNRDGGGSEFIVMLPLSFPPH
ncbi:HAMP domain-containing histidine kinase [bacterium]|jgi:signal transduction histidine kinase|nr:HAMP domain-containing histidine kinase [bacterium]